MHTEYVCYPVTIIMHLRNVYSLHGGALGGISYVFSGTTFYISGYLRIYRILHM